jgi:hypothetical protein
MSDLNMLKKAFDGQENYLAKLAYHSWLTLQLGKLYTPSIDMLDDLYTGFVSGAMYNLGSGKTPEYMEGIGPTDEERFSKKKYENLFHSLVELGTHAFPFEGWIKSHPESEEWADWIQRSIVVEGEYLKQPEKWLLEFRELLINSRRNEQ